MKPGDLLKIIGNKYGELVGIDEDNNLEVYFISRGKNKWVWEYDEDWEVVTRNEVVEHIELKKGTALESYKKLGFRPLTENTFIKLDDDIPKDVIVPLGDFDENDSSDLDSDDSLNDFIVPDEEGEEFRPASPTNEFVIETHKCVHKYNNWEPQKPEHKKIKNFIDKLSHKYQTKDDNRQFAKGQSVDYEHPPLKKLKSSK